MSSAKVIVNELSMTVGMGIWQGYVSSDRFFDFEAGKLVPVKGRGLLRPVFLGVCTGSQFETPVYHCHFRHLRIGVLNGVECEQVRCSLCGK